MTARTPRSTLPDPLFPHATLFRTIRPAKFESRASALGISLGTLLLGHGYADPSQPVRIDPATLAEALKLVDYDEDLGGEYEPQERARQVISAYEIGRAHV